MIISSGSNFRIGKNGFAIGSSMSFYGFSALVSISGETETMYQTDSSAVVVASNYSIERLINGNY